MKPPRAGLGRGAAYALLAILASGCLGEPRVARVYDGKVVVGPFVSPEGYAGYLRGTLAEEAGDVKGALAAYDVVLSDEGDDPLVLARVGELECRLDPASPRADRAFARAERVDPAFAGTPAAKARCASLRGRHPEAAAFAQRASELDPDNVAFDALDVTTTAAAGGALRDPPGWSGRQRLMAPSDADARARFRVLELTKMHGDRVVAWDALLAWGRHKRDAELVAQALRGLVRVAPTRSPELERGAVELLRGGHDELARSVASALADAPEELGVRGLRDETAARLAVDDALSGGDDARASRRAMKGRVPVAELAARALVLGRRELATALASDASLADPTSVGARMVVEAARAGDINAKTLDLLAAADAASPALCALVLASRIAEAAGPPAASAWLRKVKRSPLAAHDPLGRRLASELTARGVAVDAPASTTIAPSSG